MVAGEVVIDQWYKNISVFGPSCPGAGASAWFPCSALNTLLGIHWILFICPPPPYITISLKAKTMCFIYGPLKPNMVPKSIFDKWLIHKQNLDPSPGPLLELAVWPYVGNSLRILYCKTRLLNFLFLLKLHKKFVKISRYARIRKD